MPTSWEVPKVGIWMFPKIVGFPPKSSIKKMGFSIIFTIHFGVPLFLETPISQLHMGAHRQVGKIGLDIDSSCNQQAIHRNMTPKG